MRLLRIFIGWRAWWAPALLIVFGFWLRSAYYYEAYNHPDERITVEVVKYMRLSGDWDTNWVHAEIEPALRYDQYNFSSHIYATFFFYRLVKLIPAFEGWRSVDNGFLVYRFFVGLLASVAVWQTWLIGKRLAGDAAGLAAGALVAVTPLLVQDAHFVRPEPFVTVFTLAAVMLSWPSPVYRRWRVFGAAVVVGLLIACKFSCAALAWMPLVPVLATVKANGSLISRGLVAAGLTLVGIAVGFCLGAPGAVLHPALFWNGVEHLTKQYAGLHPPHSHVLGGPVADMLGAYFWTTLGAPALIAWGAGVVWLMARRRWALALLLVGPVALFVGYFCTRSVFFERNLSHVVPLFCVVSGAGAVMTARALASWWNGRVGLVTAALVFLLLIRPAEVSRRLVFLEFSGINQMRREAFDEKLRAAHPDKEWQGGAVLNSAPVTTLIEHFQHGGKPVLFRIIDYQDPWSARFIPEFEQRLEAVKVAEYPSDFHDVSGCTLQTYTNSSTDHYYVVSGVRKP